MALGDGGGVGAVVVAGEGGGAEGEEEEGGGGLHFRCGGGWGLRRSVVDDGLRSVVMGRSVVCGDGLVGALGADQSGVGEWEMVLCLMGC